jgi:hypothetical protein
MILFEQLLSNYKYSNMEDELGEHNFSTFERAWCV